MCICRSENAAKVSDRYVEDEDEKKIYFETWKGGVECDSQYRLSGRSIADGRQALVLSRNGSDGCLVAIERNVFAWSF